ncbi:MAG: type II toxin-antitoxin system HicA family toxin [Terriglobales bacterium]
MKRTDLLRHLQAHRCDLVRDSGKHTIYANRERTRFTAVPRHREINRFTARNICRDLDIPEPPQC